MLKFFDVKLVTQRDKERYERERYIMEIYVNWIMWVFIQQVLFGQSLLRLSRDMLIVSGNRHTKDTEMSYGYEFIPLQTISLPTIVDTQPAPIPVAAPRSNNMYDDDFNDDSTENKTFAKMHEDTREWFINELDTCHDKMLTEARNEYIGGDCPDTLKGAVAKIQTGDFTIKAGYSEDYVGAHAITYGLRWTSKPADEDNFKRAREIIRKAYQQTYRGIMACVAYSQDLPGLINRFEKTDWRSPLLKTKLLEPLPADF